MPKPGSTLAIEEAARRAAAWEWAEVKLYEVTGSWARASGSSACKLYFDSASQHHAWRAELWCERLRGRLVPAYPVGPGGGSAPAPDLVEAPSEDAAKAARSLSALMGDTGRLAAHCRVVLARSVVGYRGWQEVCGRYADRPVARALSVALADVLADWEEASAVLAEALDGGGAPAVAEAAKASAEADAALFRWGFW